VEGNLWLHGGLVCTRYTRVRSISLHGLFLGAFRELVST
jgi:hypothetical protein